MDLELLMSTCNKMSVDDVFGEVLPEQPILLALLNQLPYNLHQDLEIKSSYLVETVLALDLADQVVSMGGGGGGTVLALDLADQVVSRGGGGDCPGAGPG